MLHIDGATGEGGGQILRTALSLSMLRGVPVRIARIRAGRRKPGLLRQHLAAVEAAATLCQARTEGAALGSGELEFTPGPVRAGQYHVRIGSAGSTTLVLQTLLPALLRAPGPSELEIEGGTHNPMAPSVDFLEHSFLPPLRAQGADIELTLLRHGFYPAGGGRLRVRVRPAPLAPLQLCERGSLRGIGAEALVAALPRHIGERELAVVRQRFAPGDDALRLLQLDATHASANVLTLRAHCARHCETVVAYGEVGKRAEEVAAEACSALAQYLDSGAAVGEHLADQLLLPALLGGGGVYTTHRVSEHLRSNIDTIERMGAARITLTTLATDLHQIRVAPI